MVFCSWPTPTGGQWSWNMDVSPCWLPWAACLGQHEMLDSVFPKHVFWWFDCQLHIWRWLYIRFFLENQTFDLVERVYYLAHVFESQHLTVSSMGVQDINISNWAASKTSMMKLHKGLVLEWCLRKLNPAERKLAEAVAEASSTQVDAEAMRKQALWLCGAFQKAPPKRSPQWPCSSTVLPPMKNKGHSPPGRALWDDDVLAEVTVRRQQPH